MRFSALPGFRDAFPDVLARRRRILGVWQSVAARYGFEEYDGPPLESLELYTAKSGDEKERASDPADPLTAFVFKTVSDPFVGHITMFRVFSGRLRPDSSVFNATQHTEERIGQLFSLRGKEHENVSEVAAGDIGAVAKLKDVVTGDVLVDRAKTVVCSGRPTEVTTVKFPVKFVGPNNCEGGLVPAGNKLTTGAIATTGTGSPGTADYVKTTSIKCKQ